MVRICDFEQREPRNSPWLFPFSWEQRRLGDYLETSLEKNTECTYTVDDVLSVSGDFGVINQIEFQGRSFAGASVANYGILHVGEVVYTKSPLKASPYGIIKTNKGKTGIVSVLYGVYHPKENLHSDLVQTYFEQNARLNNYLRPLVNKGAKNTLLISDDDALQGEVIFPLQKAEQEKISSFFKSLDRLITLHQRKQFCICPKFGIFHNEKTNAWEQRELGKVAPIIMGQSPDGSTYSDSPSTYILVQGNADLKDGWVVPRIWTTQATKQAVAGDLIMSVRAPAGTMGKTAYNVVLGRGVAAIKGSEFIYQILVKMDSDGYWKKLSCGSTFESLNSDNIFAAEVSLPSSAEQQKIGQFFQSLDRLITLHQRKPLFLFLEELRC